MSTTMRIEVAKPKDKTMEAAIASRELEQNVTTETNGQFVVYYFKDITGLDMFKLGMCYHNLCNIN